MRKLITICERFEFMIHDDPELLSKCVQQWEGDGRVGDSETDENPTIDLTSETIAAAQKELRAIFAPTITIYRAMVVSPYRLSAESPLGKCWTYDRSKAMGYNARGGRELIFTATVDQTGVDWIGTAALNGNGEREIRLDIDAKVALVKIEDANGELVREDLYGQTFDAWRYI